MNKKILASGENIWVSFPKVTTFLEAVFLGVAVFWGEIFSNFGGNFPGGNLSKFKFSAGHNK